MLSVNVDRKRRFSHRRSRYDPLILEAFQRLDAGWHTSADISSKIQHSTFGEYPPRLRLARRITLRLQALHELGYVRQHTLMTGESLYKYEPALPKKKGRPKRKNP